MIGDMQINLDQVGTLNSERRDRSKNLHEDNQIGSRERSSQKKRPLATMIAHAGGAGGGIRQNVKVIKSKNAQSTGPWNTGR
jgi:hypothetical protein